MHITSSRYCHRGRQERCACGSQTLLLIREFSAAFLGRKYGRPAGCAQEWGILPALVQAAMDGGGVDQRKAEATARDGIARTTSEGRRHA